MGIQSYTTHSIGVGFSRSDALSFISTCKESIL